MKSSIARVFYVGAAACAVICALLQWRAAGSSGIAVLSRDVLNPSVIQPGIGWQMPSPRLNAGVRYFADPVVAGVTHHLYVALNGGCCVELHPLRNGIPSQKPSAMIYLGTSTIKIATGPGGWLFTTYFDQGTYYVAGYAPGNLGPKPDELLPTNFTFEGGFAVDRSGDLYVAGFNGTESFVEIFGPRTNGTRSIIQTISSLPGPAVDMKVAPDGELWAADGGRHLFAYEDPITSPRLAHEFCTLHQSFFVAVNDGHEAFIGSSYPNVRHSITVVDRRSPLCPAAEKRAILPRHDPFLYATGVVAYNGLLYSVDVASSYQGRGGEVFVLEPRRGTQEPLAIVTRGDYGYGADLDVGS